jgi:type IV pilus assembly protein PilX
MKNLLRRSARRNEQGSALVIGIVFLLVLTMLGLVGMQGSILEERMAGNTRDRELAFRSGEAALRDGESFLTVAALPPFDGTGGLYQPAEAGNPPQWETVTWNSTDSLQYSSTSLVGLAAQPRYIIEELPPLPVTGESEKFGALPEAEMFRVTTRAVGGTANAVVMLQSTYRR